MTDMTQNDAAQTAEIAPKAAQAHGQQHPIKLYLIVWGWLFVLSTFSYLVDYFDFHGYLRWFLILLFMMLKAGLIVAIFMHMAWERLALVIAILTPPLALLAFVAVMAAESDYTNGDRVSYFGVDHNPAAPSAAPAHHAE
jgi:cytochrome c oxidase subunit IV